MILNIIALFPDSGKQISMSEKELQELTWDEFVDRLGIYPELMVYMHERGLVNMERVQEEE